MEAHKGMIELIINSSSQIKKQISSHVWIKN